MSIFNLQKLKEKAEIKKQQLEEKKKVVPESINSENIVTGEYIFVRTLNDISEITNLTNANMALYEAAIETIREDSSPLLKDIIYKYLEAYSNINVTMREKCSAIQSSINILNEELKAIPEDTDNYIIKTGCQYTNLGYLRNGPFLKTLIKQQFSMMTAGDNSYESISTFRNYVRDIILNAGDVEFDKESFIKALYGFFRGDGEEELEIRVTRDSLISNVAETNKVVILFNHDMLTTREFLEGIVKQSNVIDKDNYMVVKRVETILAEYALLFAARADAIVEFTDTIRDQLASFIELYNGGGRDE